MRRCKSLTIFEGPDGSGKTTAAKSYANALGAEYVHFPALPNVSSGLARMYVEAMLPALLGYSHVVFDRSWLSEGPYGEVFREGQDRLGRVTNRMLERLAYRCSPMLVNCMVSSDTMVANYLSRKNLEMLDNEHQLMEVKDLYLMQNSHLPQIYFNYENQNFESLVDGIYKSRGIPHFVDTRSAGNPKADIMLVGDSFAERKNNDPFYQWPFASFSDQGCSRWFTQYLEESGMGESGLFWVNSDQDLKRIGGVLLSKPMSEMRIVALGNKAAERLKKIGVENFIPYPHPQYLKRFNKEVDFKEIING